MIEDAPEEMVLSIKDYLEERFGLDRACFDGYAWYLSPTKVFLGPAEPSIEKVTPGLAIVSRGVVPKPTTNLFQLFGNQVTRSIVTVDRATALISNNPDQLSVGNTTTHGVKPPTGGESIKIVVTIAPEAVPIISIGASSANRSGWILRLDG